MVCLSSVVHHQAKVSQQSFTPICQKYVFSLYVPMYDLTGMSMYVRDRIYELVNDSACIMCSEDLACFLIIKMNIETLFVLVLKYQLNGFP